jgi:peptide-methionine (S)-S-oxide reductase
MERMSAGGDGMGNGSKTRTTAALAAAGLILLGCAGRAASPAVPAAGTAALTAAAFPDPPGQSLAPGAAQVAVLAGGCFWGVEGVFERLTGVTDAMSGYSGGAADTAHYEVVGSGTTGHAESVRITYDPARISYGMILKVFFSVAHDPTQLGYQGPDVGSQYRSAIFYANDEQKKVAEQYIDTLNKAQIFGAPIVTEVVPLRTFYPAEDYHQDFMDRNPSYPYIVMWDRPKVINLQRMYPGLLSGKSASSGT